MSNWISFNDKHKSIISEIQGQTDRAAAIVAFAFIEDRLAELLVAKLADQPKIIDKMFKGLGPLATFAAKNDMAFLMGIYPNEDFYRQLITIKDIRNKFAHAAEPITFETQAVKALCANLTFPHIPKPRGPKPKDWNKYVSKNVERGAEVIISHLVGPIKTPRDRYLGRIRLCYLFFELWKEMEARKKKPAS